jgi:hypothetical protein
MMKHGPRTKIRSPDYVVESLMESALFTIDAFTPLVKVGVWSVHMADGLTDLFLAFCRCKTRHVLPPVV